MGYETYVEIVASVTLFQISSNLVLHTKWLLYYIKAQTIGDDGLIALPPGQSLSLRFAKGVDRKRSRYDRGSSSSGVGPSIGIEVRSEFLEFRVNHTRDEIEFEACCLKAIQRKLKDGREAK